MQMIDFNLAGMGDSFVLFPLAQAGSKASLLPFVEGSLSAEQPAWKAAKTPLPDDEEEDEDEEEEDDDLDEDDDLEDDDDLDEEDEDDDDLEDDDDEDDDDEDDDDDDEDEDEEELEDDDPRPLRVKTR